MGNGSALIANGSAVSVLRAEAISIGVENGFIYVRLKEPVYYHVARVTCR